jgi:predicted enzyme related to lactoylglutathione lyase
MNLTLSHAFVLVHDQDEALRFYRDVLGLRVRHDVAMEGFRWLTLSPPSQPEVEIVLEVAAMGRPPADHAVLESLMAKGSLSGLIFQTEDCDATFEKIRAAGAEVVQEPTDQPYGVRDCGFRDPSGNHLRFSQPLGG